MENDFGTADDRGLLRRKMEAGVDVIIETDRAAVLRNTTNPRAKFHFLVLPKMDIKAVTELKNEHLPLLDDMMDLAIRAIQQHKLSPNFYLIGFKMNPYMDRLIMHCISKDFHSEHMCRPHHWTIFNTELFITFQALYAKLAMHSTIEPLTPDVLEQLRLSNPFECNQCTYKCRSFNTLKCHLDDHFKNRTKRTLQNLMRNCSIRNSAQPLHPIGRNRNAGSRNPSNRTPNNTNLN